MGWCPDGHGEFREGITVCATCGQELVEVAPEVEVQPVFAREARLARRLGRRLAEALAREPDWQAEVSTRPRVVRAETGEAYDSQLMRLERWPRLVLRHFLSGLWLFPHAAWRLLRMRNVWIVILLLGLVDTAAWVLPPAPILPPEMEEVLQNRQWSLTDSLESMERRWRSPHSLGMRITEGAQFPFYLTNQVAIRIALLSVGNDMNRLVASWAPLWSLHGVVFSILIPCLLGALVAAGLLLSLIHI